MTRLLQDTMHERAEDIEQPRLELDAVMAAGERRRRRRGTIAVAGVAAACAVVGFGAVQVAGTPDDADKPGYATTGGFTERKVTYAAGSTIHYGDEQIDVGRTVYSFVQTDAGFVVTDKAGGLYLADGAEVEKIGTGADGHLLRSDDAGPYVTWADESAKQADFVVYDTATRSEVVRVPVGRPSRDSEQPSVYAVDGNGAYVLDGRGLVRIDIPSGRVDPLRRGVTSSRAVPDVEDGWILRNVNRSTDGGDDVPLGTVISRDPNATAPRTVADARDLSPDARYVATDYNDSERIYDVRTNQEMELETSEHDFQALSQWIDGDTAAMMTLDGPDSDPEVSLQRCEVSSGECTVSVDGLGVDIELPVGEHIAR